MVVLPPGTLLQLMYLRDRLKSRPAGTFIEVGPGSGEISQLLLELGWSGCAYDLEEKTIAAFNERFRSHVESGRIQGIHGSFLESKPDEKADLIVSCMVMEHLDDTLEAAFMQHVTTCLKDDGLMIGLVPSSPAHWGIEDDIAGHCRRYTRESMTSLMQRSGWRLLHLAGLTYPISNLLLPVSNYLVRKNERSKLALSALERTKLSGRRNVRFKTHFPFWLGLLLNRVTLYPLHVCQKIFQRSPQALVLYFEARPTHAAP